MLARIPLLCIFFFKYTATTEIYTYCHTLSLHDALPICLASAAASLDDDFRDMLDLRSLVGKTVQSIDRYQFGWRMRFTDSTVICVNECQTFDRVGNFVRDP